MSSYPVRLARTGLLPLCLAAAAPLLARDTLTEEAAVRHALGHAEIAARDAAQRAAGAAEIAQHGALPNPSLEIAHESVGDVDEWQVGIAQRIDLSGEQSALRSAAAAEARATEADMARRRQELVAETRRAYGACAAARAESAVIERYVHALRALERGLADDVRASSAVRIRAEAAALHREGLLARGEKEAACIVLSSLTGVPDPQALQAPKLPVLEGDEHNRSDIRAMEHRVAAAGERVRAARQGRLPEFELGAALKRVEDGFGPQQGVVFSLGVELPLFNRGGAAVAAEQARQRAFEAELTVVRRAIEAEKAAAAARARAASDAADHAIVARDEAAAAARMAEQAYLSGTLDVGELLDVLGEVAGFERAAIQAHRAAGEAALELDLAAGKGIP